MIDDILQQVLTLYYVYRCTVKSKKMEKMDMEFRTSLREDIISNLSSLITIREEQLAWMNKFIEEVKIQEIAVNSVKTAAATGAVISTVTLFTPLAPVGM